jgi:hypothetical protein
MISVLRMNSILGKYLDSCQGFAMRLSCSFFLIAIGISIFGCGSIPSRPSGNSSGGFPLFVVSTDPANGATNVPLSQCAPNAGFCGGLITVVFSVPVVVDSVKLSIIPEISGFLRCDIVPPRVPGCLNPNMLNSNGGPLDQPVGVVRFVSMSNFLADTEYKVTVLAAGDGLERT